MITKEEAIKYLIKPVATSTEIGEEKQKEFETYNMAIEALQAESEQTVIRSRTFMPTKDFKEWAKRVREENPNVIVIPCDAEVVSAEETVLNKMLEQDYVRVVRCKDCCHRVHDEERNVYYCEMYYGQGDVSDENFCQWGERRKNDEH